MGLRVSSCFVVKEYHFYSVLMIGLHGNRMDCGVC